MNHLEPLDASLGGQWRLKKWLPKQADEYENDYRWSTADTPYETSEIPQGFSRFDMIDCVSDVQGFYYEWNGSYHRIEIDDNFVCFKQATGLVNSAALLATIAALMVSF